MIDNSEKKDDFIFNWILKKRLAIGTTPTKIEDINLLNHHKVKNILGLCSEDECKWHKNLENNFICKRIILPDSRKKKLPSESEIDYAFNTLRNFVQKNITFIHCFASIERSPLLCIMYIMEKYDIELEESLDYVKSVHRMTNPRNKQLLLIKNYKFKKY